MNPLIFPSILGVLGTLRWARKGYRLAWLIGVFEGMVPSMLLVVFYDFPTVFPDGLSVVLTIVAVVCTGCILTQISYAWFGAKAISNETTKEVVTK